jgi:hypothetical protein
LIYNAIPVPVAMPPFVEKHLAVANEKLLAARLAALA